jgi:hypothetical protein
MMNRRRSSHRTQLCTALTELIVSLVPRELDMAITTATVSPVNIGK